jgi:UPF0716 protein FxsA
MFPTLLIIFIVIPVLELALLIEVGSVIGAWSTILIVLITAVAGSAMLRAQSMSTFRNVQSQMAAGQLPADKMLEGVLLLIGGLLLLTPGFITDAFGFFCLVPLSRTFMVRLVIARINFSGFIKGSEQMNNSSRADTSKPTDRSVIEGECRREDD